MINIKKNTGIIIGAILILVIVFYIFSTNTSKNGEISKDLTLKPEITNSSTAYGTYEAYTEEKINRAEKGTVILFFHASWCPSCRALNKDIESNKEFIPSNLTILKTDYDSEKELKQKYGVTTQHTLVQVDKDGNLIKKWSGGSKLTNLISQIN